MADYLTDGNGNWFKVSLTTRLQVESGAITLATATSGVPADAQA